MYSTVMDGGGVGHRLGAWVKYNNEIQQAANTCVSLGFCLRVARPGLGLGVRGLSFPKGDFPVYVSLVQDASCSSSLSEVSILGVLGCC
ncbi:hypothetical protein VUR80DRAFT_6261 [Thermomyces stellatus]